MTSGLDDRYRPVEWLGGPLDGEIVYVEIGADHIIYPPKPDRLSMGHDDKIDRSRVPIRRGMDKKEYLHWHERLPT